MFGSAYWSIYKRIEQEVLELSHHIYFDDNQLRVYSNEILDLILRISTNIESLYEDIYRGEYGKADKKIGEMIKKINESFSLEDKIIRISNDNFHFSRKIKKIKPFQYRSHDENDFYSAYNAIKHNRSKNIRQANINILLRALAAFYALCVIYDDKWTPLQNSIWGTKTPYIYSYNTDIFSADVYDKQLDYAQQSIMSLAMQIDSVNKNEKPCIRDLMEQCENNLKIRFRSQHPEECLFMARLTPEYMKQLDEFKKKYCQDNVAAEIELNLIFGNFSDKKAFEKIGIDNLDVLMDHINMNLERVITTIAVNRESHKDKLFRN